MEENPTYLNISSFVKKKKKKECLISFLKLGLPYIQIVPYACVWSLRLKVGAVPHTEAACPSTHHLAKPLLALLLVQRSVRSCRVLPCRGDRNGEEEARNLPGTCAIRRPRQQAKCAGVLVWKKGAGQCMPGKGTQGKLLFEARLSFNLKNPQCEGKEVR